MATETTTDPARRTWQFTPKTIAENVPAGPWDSEPDKVQWVDKATDLDCLMLRNHFGAWCGYVGVPQDHPLYQHDYDNVPAYAHGGLTFASLCEPGEPIVGICHIAEPGREQAPWWFGFDCAHGGDLQPGMAEMTSRYGLSYYENDVYRDEKYVHDQVTSLAEQLHDLGKGEVPA